MTAAQIAKVLGLTQIEVNYHYREWLDQSFYKENPILGLNIKVTAHDLIVKTWLDGIDFKIIEEDQHDLHSFWPENQSQTKERTNQIIKRKVTKYGDHEKKVLHLVVSHGMIVEFFSTLNGGERTYPEYCAISALEIEQNQVKLLRDGDSSHVVTKH